MITKQQIKIKIGTKLKFNLLEEKQNLYARLIGVILVSNGLHANRLVLNLMACVNFVCIGHIYFQII